MGRRGKSTVIKSASIPVELAKLMETNNISPSEAMRVGILSILEGREYVFVDQKLEELFREKETVKLETPRDAREVMDKMPVSQLPVELKVKKIAMNIYERVKDTMVIDRWEVVDAAATSGVPIEDLEEELRGYGVDLI